MSPQLVERIEVGHRRRFVGRAAELGLFGAAIYSEESPFNVPYIHGPGGMGKMTLLGEFSHLCRSSGIQASYVDARNLEPSPDSFMAALLLILDPDPQGSPLETFASQTNRQVVMVDTCETLAPLNPWINEVFLPRIPENTLLVMTSRNAPEARWRMDPGWQSFVRVLSLGNLSKEESRVYLSRRNVPADQHQAILDFTYGHPLALVQKNVICLDGTLTPA